MASATFEKLSKVLNKIDINLVVNDLIMINLPGLDIVFDVFSLIFQTSNARLLYNVNFHRNGRRLHIPKRQYSKMWRNFMEMYIKQTKV